MKKDDDISMVKLVHILHGRPPRNANPVYARVNARVRTVVALRQPSTIGLFKRYFS